MGGAVKSVTHALGGAVSTATHAIGSVVGGTVGSGIGGAVMGPVGAALGGGIGAIGGWKLGSGGSGSASAPNVGVVSAEGQQNPLQMLTSSGGAPLLMDIALGADVGTSLMSYFGASGNYNSWFNSLSADDQKAVQGLHDQLTQIQTNTNTQNQVVQKLASDYPNIMTAKIQQYRQVADPAIKSMMNQALQQISAKQAAGGNFSSGATAEAAARVGAQYAGDELSYATKLAQQDFDTQLNTASALQTFQQKMLGQGASQGFNAIQNALSRDTQLNIANAGYKNQANLAAAGYQNEANLYNTKQQNAMSGALGGLAGTVLGGVFGGPVGASIGGTLGSTFGGSPSFTPPPMPKLNFGSPTSSGGGSPVMPFNNVSNSGTFFPGRMTL